MNQPNQDYEKQFHEGYFADMEKQLEAIKLKKICALCGEPWPHEKCGVNSMAISII